jgi:hypothetical protein
VKVPLSITSFIVVVFDAKAKNKKARYWRFLDKLQQKKEFLIGGEIIIENNIKSEIFLPYK